MSNDGAKPCRSCGSPVVWIETASGRRMPLDPPRLSVVLDDGRTVTGRRSHFATCPEADSWRGKGRAAASVGGSE